MVKWPNVPKDVKVQPGLAMVIVAKHQKKKIKIERDSIFSTQRNQKKS